MGEGIWRIGNRGEVIFSVWGGGMAAGGRVVGGTNRGIWVGGHARDIVTCCVCGFLWLDFRTTILSQ